MEILPNTDGDRHTVEITETERRVLIDALTNLSLDAARGAAGSDSHDGRASPSADYCGSYMDASQTAKSMSKELKGSS